MIVAKAVAADSHLTLDELAAFVQQALRSETPGNARVKARVGMSGHVKTIETDIPKEQR